MNAIPPEFPSTSSAFPSVPIGGPHAMMPPMQQNSPAPNFMHNPPMYGAHPNFPMAANGFPMPPFNEHNMHMMAGQQPAKGQQPTGGNRRSNGRNATGHMPLNSPSADPMNGMSAQHPMSMLNGRPLNGPMPPQHFPMPNGPSQMGNGVRQGTGMNGADMNSNAAMHMPPPYPYPPQQFWQQNPNCVPPDMPSTSSAFPTSSASGAPMTMPDSSNGHQNMPGPQSSMNSPNMMRMNSFDESPYPNGFTVPHPGAAQSNKGRQQCNGNGERSASRGAAGSMSISSPSVSSSMDPSSGMMSPYSGGQAMTPLKNGTMPQHPFNQIYPSNGGGQQQSREYAFPPGMPNKGPEAEWHMRNGSPGQLGSPMPGDMAFMGHPLANMGPNGYPMPHPQPPQPAAPKSVPRSRKRKASAQAVSQSPGPTPSPHLPNRPESIHNGADYGQPMSAKPDTTAPICSSADGFRPPSGPAPHAPHAHASNQGNSDEDNPLKKIERMTDLALKEPSSGKSNRLSDASRERESNLIKQQKIDYIENMTKQLTEQPQQPQPQPMVPYGAMARMPSQPRMMHPGAAAFVPYASPTIMASMTARGFMRPTHPYPMPMGPNGQPMQLRGPFPPHPMSMCVGPMNGGPQPMSPTLMQHPAGPMQGIAARTAGAPPSSAMMHMQAGPAQMMPRMMVPGGMPPNMAHPMMMPPGSMNGMMPTENGKMPSADAIPGWPHMHPMPQSLSNLEARVPSNKVQYLPDGQTVVANCAPTAAS